MANAPNYRTVSSNTLFHFTNEIEYLISVLKNNFRPRYCLEIFEDSVGERIAEIAEDVNFAVPMVCFCDIPLSLTANHMETYGYYGLGLTKEWGMKKGLSPLMYCHANSPIIDVMGDNSWTIDFLKGQERLSKNTEDALSRILWNIAFLSCFMKPYQGSFYRKGVLINDVRFYNEREWRYVPNLETMSNLPSVIYKSDAMNSDLMADYNQRLYNCNEAALEFTPNDVKYIVVRSESELLEIEGLIDNLKEEYSESDRRLLKTRLISSEKILEDF